MAVLNVLVTKLVSDRFVGKESATAMGLLLAVWPAGIALALAVLGGLATAFSWQVSEAITGAWPLLALALVGLLYRDPPQPPKPSPESSDRNLLPSLRMLGLASAAGWAWTLYNCGLIALVSFGPTVLVERGVPLAQAGLLSSFITWGVMIGTPVGGLISDATKRPRALVVFACLSASAVIVLALIGNSALHFLLMGLLIGLPTGPIMAMLGESLPESDRGFGYGVLLTWYYVGLGVAPAGAGWIAEAAGNPKAILPLSAALVVATLIPYGLFQASRARGTPASTRTTT